MNSEISNVVKLSPVTVVKADKQAEERASTVVKVEQEAAAAQSSSNKAADKVTEKRQEDKKTKLSSESVKKAVDEGNTLLQAVKRNLQFKVDDTTQEVVVKIIDSDSGELVRQIPSEEMLAFIKRMKEMEGEQGFVIEDRA